MSKLRITKCFHFSAGGHILYNHLSFRCEDIATIILEGKDQIITII